MVESTPYFDVCQASYLKTIQSISYHSCHMLLATEMSSWAWMVKNPGICQESQWRTEAKTNLSWMCDWAEKLMRAQDDPHCRQHSSVAA